MMELAGVQVIVHGRVQGVNFRYFVERNARALELTGYVRNLSSGREVEVYAEGSKENLDELLNRLENGPRMAIVGWLDIQWQEYTGNFNRFSVTF